MTMTQDNLDGVFEYLYNVSVMEMGQAVEKGWIYARHDAMPFVDGCYGVMGMRQVVVFPISMEVLR